jgi:UDP-N-acetylglucosamine acyltransferase
LPPFVMCQGQPAQARSMNYEGLRRRGFSAERLAAVKAMHRALYRQELTLAQARQAILELKKSNPQAEQDIDAMLGFLDQTSSQRGIVR